MFQNNAVRNETIHIRATVVTDRSVLAITCSDKKRDHKAAGMPDVMAHLEFASGGIF